MDLIIKCKKYLIKAVTFDQILYTYSLLNDRISNSDYVKLSEELCAELLCVL